MKRWVGNRWGDVEVLGVGVRLGACSRISQLFVGLGVFLSCSFCDFFFLFTVIQFLFSIYCSSIDNR